MLAVTAGIVLIAAILTPTMSDSTFAQVTSESRVLQAILGLTEHLKWHTEELVDTTENIDTDLEFKKKFYEFETEVQDVPILAIGVNNCAVNDTNACAFNVESIQLLDNGTSRRILGIIVDGVYTDLSSKQILTPTNLLVDSGQGKIGAATMVAVVFDSFYSGIVEWTGEKPQGMELGEPDTISFSDENMNLIPPFPICQALQQGPVWTHFEFCLIKVGDICIVPIEIWVHIVADPGGLVC
jgi:hypothetical protein